MNYNRAQWLALASFVSGMLAVAFGLTDHYFHTSDATLFLALAATCLVGLLLAVLAVCARPGTSGRIFMVCGFALNLVAVLLGYLLLQAGQDNHLSFGSLGRHNLRPMAHAVHHYHDHEGKLPPQAIYDKNGKPILSWRVLILPYIKEKKLYDEFHLDEPWDSPHNIKLLDRMPQIFRILGSNPAEDGWKTPFQVLVGKGAIFDGDQRLTLTQLSEADGTSNTILIVTTDKMVPWTKPEDIPFSADESLPEMGRPYPDNPYYLFRGPPKRLLWTAFADGKCGAWLIEPGEEARLRAMITWNGGEMVTPP